jgi:diguanylate cyclase (GGDEF)-like protein
LRSWLAACLLTLIACLSQHARAEVDSPFEVQVLDAAVTSPSLEAITSGALDSRFGPFKLRETRRRGGVFWLKLSATHDFAPPNVATLNVRKGRHLHVDVFTASPDRTNALPRATELPEYAGAQQAIFVLPQGLRAGQTLYARIEPRGEGAEELKFQPSTLDATLALGEEHHRTIALAFGALMSMALATILIWFVLADKLFLLYGVLIALQALYIAYLSGQGFDWPVLSYAVPLQEHSWNVPAALSGAVASLFIREIADLQRFSPRVHRIFGWLAVTFVVLAISNVGIHFGLGTIVVAVGNIIFLSTAAFTVIVAFLAWRRGNRAAGWFLVAWGVLEGFTIATAARLLFTNTDPMLYYGLPAAMVAAAILIALGVADRMREQRAALTEAERRAQTDPLTGVLNRRSLVERLQAACLRARARGLPIALLFIDLDHFKEINDTYGHLAGDACLAAVIEPIQAELRQSDVIGRYGGEEFVVILSSADTAAAYPIAQRIRERVAAVSVEGHGKPIRLTCSIGVAASDTLGVWDESLIARADAAVYAAKRDGRNRVQVAVPRAA